MKISIIIPIYNKEKYLERCIKSVIAQSHRNLEIILVDDGSVDNSLKICKKHKKDKRIKIFHQENKGVSSARNVGLKNMTGERVIFVDADDYIKKDYVERLAKNNEGLVVSGYVINDIDYMPDPQSKNNMNKILARNNSRYIVGPIGKIFDAKIIKQNNIRFDESMNFGEDTCFVLEYLRYCRTVKFIKYAGYYNEIIEGTLSRKYIENIDAQLKKILSSIKALTHNPFIIMYWRLRNFKIIQNNRKRKDEMSLKRIGIVTLCANNNYGNKLQNFAILKVLSQKGYNVETIWVSDAHKGTAISHLRTYLWRVKKDYIDDYRRNKYFIKFNRLLNIRRNILFNNGMKKIEDDYDYFIVGSDQVWNPEYFTNNSIYLLDGITKTKIAFSASFGVSNIPKNDQNRYKKGLMQFDAISVREDRGKELVEELTNRKKKAEVLIDPTMMIDKKEWDKIARKPENLPKKYILNYFLGELSDSRRGEIERIATSKGCKIINILDKKSPFYNTGPSEFLYLEKNAELICTDSFHSSVFAILYNRPFVVFDREEPKIGNMNSRIDTLISKFKLENRRYNGQSITKDNLKHDYSEAYKILEKERAKSTKFLKEALNMKGKND